MSESVDQQRQTMARHRYEGFTEHALKCWPEYFVPILDRTKKFDLRKNDRDYKIGDRVWLREWEPPSAQTVAAGMQGEGRYTGRECWRTIEYIVEGPGEQGVIAPLKGLLQGYVILGF
jgi:hypothetical protein